MSCATCSPPYAQEKRDTSVTLQDVSVSKEAERGQVTITKSRKCEKTMVEPHRCPRCDGELSADVPEGLCPECLFRQALAGPGTAPYREEAGPSPAPAYQPPTSVELAPHFPHLEILRLLGHGGMGAVYLARQLELDRLVAVKILPPEVARDPGFKERFSREARALARLNHPSVVTIFDFGTTDGLYYFTMEYVDGKNVRELLQAGEIAQAEALKIITQVCDALQYAHDEGFVHRDIKPENILLDSKGRVKIADFGLARLVGLTPTYLTLTGSFEVMGTLYYMAPEQLRRARDVDHRADLYSLGVVFYEMLTGELPVGRFPPPSQRARVDARLDAIVLRALAREPEHRQQDAGEIKREIEVAITGGPAIPAGPAAVIRSVFPCVRFTIPDIYWSWASVKGEIYRDETTLNLDFSVVSSFGTHQHKQLRIPFADIRMISCHTTAPADWLHWLGVEEKTEIVLRVHQPKLLSKLPAGKHGKGWLKVHREDAEAARQLVDGILGDPLPAPARPTPVPDRPDLAWSVSDHDRVRMQLLRPALGLLATAVGALVSTVALMIVLIHEVSSNSALGVSGVVIAALVPLTGAVLMMAGALRMIVGRNTYLPCVAAALLAVLPWSPAWLIGLPFGIWALAVLGRPEVMAAFLDKRRGVRSNANGASNASDPTAGVIRSLLRSVAGYFVTTAPGARARQPGAEEPVKNQE
jgi:serine/threonine protein kinase